MAEAAMVMVAAWVAPIAIEKLTDFAISYAKKHKCWQLGMNDELNRLKSALPEIRAVLEAAENGVQIESSKKLQDWMWRLRDAVEEAEDVLDELEYHRMHQKVNEANKTKKKLCCGTSQFKKTIRHVFKGDPILKGLGDSVKKLDMVAAHVGDFLDLVRDNDARQRKKKAELIEHRVTGSLVSTSTGVLGRDKERDQIIHLLLESNTATSSSSHNPSILPIVGFGGVGKTTLAQYIYNDTRIEKHFDPRIWVCVSNVFDPTTLLQNILDGVTGSKSTVGDLATLQETLKKKLSSKKYLLVLDDVWNDSDRDSWEKLFAPLKFGQNGSWVVVTTRLERVRDMYPGMTPIFPLKGLQDEDAFRSLFKKCAFGDVDPAVSYPGLEAIGIQISDKLKGHPLAAKIVGGQLKAKLGHEEYWARTLSNINSYLGEGEINVISILRLSYQQLPGHLQTCFRYCSIFPQDYEFRKDELVHMWMGAGLIQQCENETPEDTGKSYFDDLVKRSFFEMTVVYTGRYVSIVYTMHDLLNELAVSVSVGECKRITTSKEGSAQEILPRTIRHLRVESDSISVFAKISELEHLRTLLFWYTSQDNDVGNDFEMEFKKLKSRGLRVFCFKVDDRVRNHNSFEFLGDFIHLRYLDLQESGINSLPESLGKIYYLQVLYVDGSLLAPEGMNNLINLRHLVSEEMVTKINLPHLISAAMNSGTFLYPSDFFYPGGPTDIYENYEIGAYGYLRFIDHGGSTDIYKIQGVGKLCSVQELHFCVDQRSGNGMEQLGDMKELRHLFIEGLEKIQNPDEADKAKLREKVHLKRLDLIWGTKERRGDADPVLAEEVLLRLKPHCSLLKHLEIWKYPGINPPIWLEHSSMTNVEFIYLVHWRNCKSLPPLGQLKCLRALVLKNIHAVKELAHGFRDDDIVVFPQLQYLYMEQMHELREWCGGRSIQHSHRWFPRLTNLLMVNCPKLRGLPYQLCHSTTLQHLIIDARPEIELADTSAKEEGFRRLCSLRSLYLENCPKLVGSGLRMPSSLERLEILRCELNDESLSISLGGGLTSLSFLVLEGGESEREQLTSLPSVEVLSQLTSLEKLTIWGFPALTTGLEGLHALPSLRSLDLGYLLEISSVPPLPSSLKSLTIHGCHPELEERCREDGGADWPNIAHIPDIRFG